MAKQRKWTLTFCPTCNRYHDYAARSTDGRQSWGYRTECRFCNKEVEEREAIPFHDELELYDKGYNWALFWRSTTTGIIYPMSLAIAYPLFSESIHGKVRKDWDWKNNGGVTKIYPAKKQESAGGVFSV